MAPKRGNSTSYHQPTTKRARELAKSGGYKNSSEIKDEMSKAGELSRGEHLFDDPSVCSELNFLCTEARTLTGNPTFIALEKMWERSVKRQTLNVAHDRGRATSFANESMKGGDIAEALDFLADMTGDSAFLTAALALRAYGLDGGGLKQDTLRMMRDHHGTGAWFAMPRMHSWRRARKSDRAAAARAAIQLGIHGATFNAVVKELTAVYPIWLKAVADNAPARQIPTGDTGRKLRVRFSVPWLDVDGMPMTQLMGVHFDEEGFGIAPDNREWRRLICLGSVALYGVVEVAKN
jgi:hypothetical protein